MNVKIIDLKSKTEVDAKIIDGKKFQLPSIQEGWRFNFQKHSKDKSANTFVLITVESPDSIEGCLIYKMRNEIEPYMAYIEIAPHNKGDSKKYDEVAGCLIAYACRLSFLLGKEDYKGWLAFDVQEADKKDEQKLMTLYSKKYNARQFEQTTTMLISPAHGEKLIERYLGI